MILRVILLSLLTSPALIQAVNIPVVCPCTFVANRAVKLVKNVLKDGDECGCSLPPLQSGETDKYYIKRVFFQKEKEPIEDYCGRIFKQYKDENNEKYIERIDKIFSVFPTLECKDNTDYWKFSEKYYTLKYGRLDSIIPLLKESKDQYCARILRREKDEDFNSFIKRMDCVFKAYPKLDIWRRIQFDSDCRNWYFYRHLAYNCAIKPSENIRESIVTKYGRRECEKDDDFSYYKRITERTTGESDYDYVERLTKIRSKFGNLSLWNNPEYINLITDYYKKLYVRKDKEPCLDYYKRLTTQSTTEDFPTYAKRLSLFERIFNDCPLWNNNDYLQILGPYYNWRYSKKPDEKNESYLKRIITRKPSETLGAYLKRLNVCRWVNRGTDLFYNKKYWPLTKNYYENFFKKGKEDVPSWLARVFKRDYKETDDEYCKRLSLVTSVQDIVGKVDIPESCLKYVSDFYSILYKRSKGEDQDCWRKRIIKRLPFETDITFQTRLKYLENIYTDCRGFVGGVLKRLFGSGNSSSTPADKEVQVLLVKKKEKERKKEVAQTKKQCAGKKVTAKEPEKKSVEEEIEELYGRKSNEDEDCWFKRITKRSPDESMEQYVKTMNLLRKYFPSSRLWYTENNYVKDYYTNLFKKLSNETDIGYFKRIVTKEPWESWKQTAQRCFLVSHLYPNITLWTDEALYDKLLKNIFEAGFQRNVDESDEQYIQRLLAKDCKVDTTPELWAKRVHLVHLATASSPVWWDEKYYSFTKSFFETWYKKDKNELCDVWMTRVLKPLAGECEKNAIKRVELIKKTTGDCGCWTEFTFKKVASSKCLSVEYLDDIEKKFFDSATTYERIYSSSKSSSRSESSEEQKSVEIVTKS